MRRKQVIASLVLYPPVEHPEAITDEDSDDDETGNPDRLPRRLLNAPAELSKKIFGPLTQVHSIVKDRKTGSRNGAKTPTNSGID